MDETAERPDGSWTLKDARAWLREQRVDGVRCPCCTQFAKIYKRPINSQQTRALILLYRLRGREWAHITRVDKSLEGNGGDISKLRYWGLVEEADETRPDGGRAGWWRITARGEQWLHGQLLVPKFAYIFDTRLLELDGPPTSVRTALGTKFNYEELMGPALSNRDTFWDLDPIE